MTVSGEGTVSTRLAGAREGRPVGGTWSRSDGRVDSVQWVLIPGTQAWDFSTLEQAYHSWAPRLVPGMVKPVWEEGPEGPLRISLRPGGWLSLLRLGPLHAESGRCYREILGGLLARPGGHLALEVAQNPQSFLLTVAVRGLKPRLPLPLYRLAQAKLHERATLAFLRQCVRAATGQGGEPGFGKAFVPKKR